MRTTTKRAVGAAGLLTALALAAGCSQGPAMGDVSGTVTVDGQTPAQGSSITFFPMDGKASSAGALIENGHYTAKVPVGMAKVEIRAPRPLGGSRPKGGKEGPGAEGALIEESLPAKYNDNSELRLEIKSGKNEKNWDLSTR